jgi:hypothetical protein
MENIKKFYENLDTQKLEILDNLKNGAIKAPTPYGCQSWGLSG